MLVADRPQNYSNSKRSDMDDYSIMPFGKYKGRQLINVPASYLIWLYDNNKAFGKLKEYIKDNLDVLQKQVNE
jgi:uncharacterized protein (DUF3820 family)